MKIVIAVVALFLMSACQEGTVEVGSQPKDTDKLETHQTKVASPVGQTLQTCEQVFLGLQKKGSASVSLDPAVSLPEYIESLKYDAANRVGDGTPALRAESVGIVGVGFWGTTANCTGTLISDRWVLTAAHCGMIIDKSGVYTGGVAEASVYVGSLSKSTDKSGRPRKGTFYCHPDFTPAPTNDLALIYLDKPVLDEAPVQLARRTDAPMSQRPTDTLMQVFGFGALAYDPDLKIKDTDKKGGDIKSEVLRTGLVTLSRPRCGPSPGRVFCSTTTGLNGGPSIGLCKGDSGGPLFIDPDGSGTLRQFGVNSYMQGGKCGEPGVTSGFADVSRYLDWIAATTKLPL